ncbi:MAG: ABC transporter substrate-binding protein [Kiritimatiellia bacterium]
MKTLSFITAAVLLGTVFCRAGEQRETRKILSLTIDQGIAILKNKESSDEQKLDSFDKLLTEKCHTELMAMLALGKKGWISFSPEQRKEFVSAFLKIMTRSYYNKLKQVDVSRVSVDYKENVKTGKSKRILKTVMSNSSEGFKVNYKFALRKGEWRIYDLEVEGISLIASYRSQFTDFLKTKSPADLLSELRDDSAKFEAEVVK